MGGFLVAFIAKKKYIYNLKLTNFNKIKLIGFFICCNKHNISYRTTVIVFNTWVLNCSWFHTSRGKVSPIN